MSFTWLLPRASVTLTECSEMGTIVKIGFNPPSSILALIPQLEIYPVIWCFFYPGVFPHSQQDFAFLNLVQFQKLKAGKDISSQPFTPGFSQSVGHITLMGLKLISGVVLNAG